MYDYHYDKMKQHYKESINLMYTDTGNIILFIYIHIFVVIIIISYSLVY